MLNDIQKLSNCLGYGEYYEWNPLLGQLNEENKLGYFVGFDKDMPDKINKCESQNEVIGVSSYSSSCVSDLPDEWPNKYVKNIYGRVELINRPIVTGKKEHDNELDMDYIKTYKISEISPVISDDYDFNSNYISRTYRNCWQNVILLGKCIVQDDGNCQPGDYCTIYEGDDFFMKGKAIKAKEDSIVKYHVLKRISNTTILILFK